MTAELQNNADIRNVEAETANPRGGLELRFDNALDQIQASDEWTLAGWRIRFLSLPPKARFAMPDTECYLKVILGSLVVPERTCFAEDFAVRSTRVTETGIEAGEQGALLALLQKSPAGALPLTTMDDCRFEGPHSDRLVWKSFSERFGAFTSYFDDLDNHMADGFHLVNPDGEEVVYVNFWTCGKNGDVSTHNHGHAPGPRSPAFVEVHLVLKNGTGEGGMYVTDGPEGQTRTHYVMQPGDEHGPFFDHENGNPIRLENGAVSYPWHGWESGTDDETGQAYDLVVAFEINPDFV